MKDWLENGIHQVKALLRQDADFQGLLNQLSMVQEKYQTVIEKLPPAEQEIIEDYIALCEEIEYQKALAACGYGKRNG